MRAPWYVRLISVLLFLPALALAESEDPDAYKSFPHLIPEINTYTGAATQNIPIAVPPGRIGIQPDLAFTYNSYSQNGIIAKGWEIPIDYIQRRSKRGVHYDGNEFDYHGKAGNVELVEISGMPDYFHARIESEFRQYRYVSGGNYWEVTHRDGTKFYFGFYPVNGTSDASRQTNTYGTFKWCLAQVQDPNGNYMTIEYIQDQGQVYPSRIDYTGNSNTSLSPTSSVVFDYETGTRPDPRISYESMALVKTAKRLTAVKTYALLPALGDTMALEYRLEYNQSPASNTSLLSRIRIIGTDGSTELPGYTFSYSQGSIGALVQGPTTETINLRKFEQSAFADTDGDNQDDFYISGCVHDSNGDGTFANLGCTQIVLDSDAAIHFADLNGDGNKDLIQYIYTETNNSSGANYILKHRVDIYLSTGDGSFTQTQTVELPKGQPGSLANSQYIALLDYNRDGYVDIYQGGMIYPSDAAGYLGSPVSFDIYPGMKYQADINGDGLTDIFRYEPELYTDAWILRTRLSKGNGTFESSDRVVTIQDLNPGMGMEHYDSIVKIQFADVNNDDMADLAMLVLNSYYSRYKMQFFLSDGQGGFNYLHGYDITPGIIRAGGGVNKMVDLNGDGQLDLAVVDFRELQNSNGDYYIASNEIRTCLTQNTAPFDLLTGAVSPSGAAISYIYSLSSRQNQLFLPFLMYPVASISVQDGVRSQPSVTNYKQELGYYDPSEKETRGFELSTRNNPDNTVIQTYHFVGLENHPDHADYPNMPDDCSQDNYYLKGRVRQVDLFETPGAKLLSRTSYQWRLAEHATDGWAFVNPAQKRTEYYDDQTVFSQEDYVYDVDTDGLTASSAGLLKKITASGTGTSAIVTENNYVNYSGDPYAPLWRTTLEKVYDDGQSNNPSRHFEYVYDAGTGNLVQKIGISHETGVDDSIWTYDYYANGLLQNEYDANGHPPTNYASYDETQTFSISIIDPLGHETVKTWDTRWGLEASVTDPNLHTTTYAYDEFGRLKQTDFPDGGYTQLVFSDYCADTDCTNVDLPRKIQVNVRTVGSQTENTLFFFDGLARKVQTSKTGESVNFIIAKTHYDNMGRAEFTAGPFFQSSDAYLAWNDYTSTGYDLNPGCDYPYVYTEFDKRGRPVNQISPDGQNGFDPTGYSYSGFATTITDPDECVKTEVRDHLDRIIEVIEDPAGEDIHTHYAYNASGDLLEVYNAFDPDASRMQIGYDTMGRKTSMDDPDLGEWSYEYYSNGELKLQTDAKGQSVEFTYDDGNRLVTKTYLNPEEPTPNVTYVYDNAANGIGRLYSVTNTDVTTTVTAYDEIGRKTEEQKSIVGATPRTASWTYDYAGRVQRLTYPHTQASTVFYVDYAYYSGTSLLYKATGPDGTVFAEMTGYQPSGKIGDLLFGNDIKTTYGYDGWSQRLTSIVTAMEQGEGLQHQNRTYTYSKAGDIQIIDDLAWVETYDYSYDKLHRLLSETTSVGSPGVIPGIHEMQYNDPDHLHAVSQVTTRGEVHNYAYDPNGNMASGPDLTDTVAVVQRSLTFNAENMPTSVVHPNGGTISITYDGEARRARKTGSNDTTYYFSNEFEQIGTTETCYVFAGNLRVAMVKDYAYDQVRYFHKDHLGSSSVISNADGTIYEKTRYMPYGGKRGDGAGITSTAYKFTDQELDKESGLYNYDARLYDPIVGRFTSADTIVPDWSNSLAFDRFAYTFNNPLKYNDPNGHFAFVAILGVAVIGAIIHEWANPSTLNAPNVGDITIERDTPTETVGKMATGAATALAILDMVTPDDSSEDEGSRKDDKPDAPPANDGNAKPHGNPDHDGPIDKKIDDWKKDPNVSDIRKNQQQVDKNNKKVGTNRPDAQCNRTDPNTNKKTHHNHEWDRTQKNSDKHLEKLKENDPDSENTGHII